MVNSSIRVISKDVFNDQYWRWPGNLQFAACDTLAPLSAEEFAKAALHMPIAFIKAEAGFIPVAVQGLSPGTNVFIGADYRWHGGYLPAVYRAYPFSLGRTSDDQLLLMVDTASGLIADTGTAPFFGSDGAPSEPTMKVLEFLHQMQSDRDRTDLICQVLAELDLFEVWPIAMVDQEAQTQLTGLFRINQQVLKQLSAEAFARLRSCDALPLIYAHFLSMQHIDTLGVLMNKQRETMAILDTPEGCLDLEYLNDSDTIRLGGFR